jgi:hypothetical protein
MKVERMSNDRQNTCVYSVDSTKYRRHCQNRAGPVRFTLARYEFKTPHQMMAGHYSKAKKTCQMTIVADFKMPQVNTKAWHRRSPMSFMDMYMPMQCRLCPNCPTTAQRFVSATLDPAYSSKECYGWFVMWEPIMRSLWTLVATVYYDLSQKMRCTRGDQSCTAPPFPLGMSGKCGVKRKCKAKV